MTAPAKILHLDAVLSSVSLGRFDLLVALCRYHTAPLCNLAITLAARHGTFGCRFIGAHGSHREGVGVVPEIEQYATTHLLESQNANGTRRVAIFDAWMT